MSTMLPPPIPPGSVPVNTHKKTPGLAIAALVLGIMSVMGAALLIVPTILAIVFGHVALSRIRKDSELGGGGVAIAGLVLGYISIVVIFVGLLAAMAIPAFQKVREKSLEKAMINDAHSIAAAAHQVMLEKGDGPVSFHIDPETGTVSGPISVYVSHVSRGTGEVDGVIESANDTFSLQNPHVNRGHEVTFDANGNMRHTTRE